MASPLLEKRTEVQGSLLKEVPPRHFSCALHFFSFSAGPMPCDFLIVDADRNFREALAIALRLDGFEVEAVGSAEAARPAVDAGGVFCCVADAHQAGADELLSAASRAGVRLVLTGPYADLLAFAGRRHQGAVLLPKPFAAAELVCSVSAPGRVALGAR